MQRQSSLWAFLGKLLSSRYKVFLLHLQFHLSTYFTWLQPPIYLPLLPQFARNNRRLSLRRPAQWHSMAWRSSPFPEGRRNSALVVPFSMRTVDVLSLSSALPVSCVHPSYPVNTSYGWSFAIIIDLIFTLFVLSCSQIPYVFLLCVKCPKLNSNLLKELMCLPKCLIYYQRVT